MGLSSILQVAMGSGSASHAAAVPHVTNDGAASMDLNTSASLVLSETAGHHLAGIQVPSAVSKSFGSSSNRTSFSAVEAVSGHKHVSCWEGFHCVSRIGKFSTGHTGTVDPSAGKGVPNPDAPEYEENCPGSDGTWRSDEYVVGEGAGECDPAKHDCLCVSGGSSDSTTTDAKGVELVRGWFDVQPPSDDIPIPKRQLAIYPHYSIRLLPQYTDLTSVSSSLGEVTRLPRQDWIAKYHVLAPRIQGALDELKNDLEDHYKNDIQDKPFVCGRADWPEDKPSLEENDVAAVKSQIRKFQLLSSDCAMVRDTAGKLIPELDDESFFSAAPGKTLNCNLISGTKRCQQLNCYRGSDDMVFRSHVREMKRILDQCRPEVDIPTMAEVEKEVAQASQTSESGVGPAVLPALALLASAPPLSLSSSAARYSSRRRDKGSHFL